jgi:hypothetical protein
MNEIDNLRKLAKDAIEEVAQAQQCRFPWSHFWVKWELITVNGRKNHQWRRCQKCGKYQVRRLSI